MKKDLAEEDASHLRMFDPYFRILAISPWVNAQGLERVHQALDGLREGRMLG